jgi:hypothetical protein
MYFNIKIYLKSNQKHYVKHTLKRGNRTNKTTGKIHGVSFHLKNTLHKLARVYPCGRLVP